MNLDEKKMRQVARNCGREYVSSQKHIKSRTTGQGCHDDCKLKCNIEISNDLGLKIFENYEA